MTETRNNAVSLILEAVSAGVLKKAVFSKPALAEELKTELSPVKIGENLMLRRVSLMKDGKAIQKNIAIDDAEAIGALAQSHSQINILTTLGDAEFKCSKSGKELLSGDRKIKNAISSGIEKDKIVSAGSNDRKKNHILSGNESFLGELGICDKNGRIHDKKQSKFRQINKFVENVRDVYMHLPSEGTLVVYDLCCGKSYLSFAVYHYLCNVLGRDVKMFGVDLKSDVIEYCNTVARDVGFTGLSFYCGDITKYECEERPDLVISLHACDIATDIVIDKAIAEGARVILSTPCCHHELNHTIKCGPLSFVTEYSMLRQKLCDAATDALRLKRLEANNYSCAALELIDPEQTPKNILLRAIKRPNTPANLKKAKAAEIEYEEARKFLLEARVDH